MTPTCALFIKVPWDDKLLISLLNNYHQKGPTSPTFWYCSGLGHTGGFLPTFTYQVFVHELIVISSQVTMHIDHKSLTYLQSKLTAYLNLA